MSTAASIIIVDLNTSDYHVLKKHWTFSDDYTGGSGWDSVVKLFTDKELVQEEENTALMDNFLIAGMRKALANLETFLVIDVLKKDGIWCRLTAVPSVVNENGEINSVTVTISNITEDIKRKYQDEQIRRRYEALQEGMSRIHDSEFLLDLDEDAYHAFKLPESVGDIPMDGKRSWFVEYFLNLLKDETVISDNYEVSFTEISKKLQTEWLKANLRDEHLVEIDYSRKRDGKKRWFRMTFFAIADNEAGEPSQVMMFTTEITEAREQELKYQEALKESAKAADIANKAKSDFLSRMSHDIRTPMNAILGFSSLLLDESYNSAQVETYANKILASGEQLLSLINDVLDMSRIESGKMDLSVRPFSFSQMMDTVSGIIKELARAKDQNFICNMRGLEDRIYIADESRISQVLINILNNSVKYTDNQGTISLSVSVKPIEGSRAKYERVRFIIEDNGQGMSEEFLQEAFEPFSRETRAGTRSSQGTGLGLSITKDLVSLMGGTIDVKSWVGEGTVFTIEIPMALPEEGSLRQISKKDEDKSYDNIFKGLNVLVCEDNTLNSEIMGRILEMNGAHVTPAFNGREALEIFKESRDGRYDLIFMDIQMPVMNGYEATKAIRGSKRPGAETIPIIAVTANAFSNDVRDALLAGMDAHVSKPVNIDEMKKTVARVFSAKKV
jgi:signal transduction histidine kinase/ActR/RegA family two-component response regulator